MIKPNYQGKSVATQHTLTSPHIDFNHYPDYKSNTYTWYPDKPSIQGELIYAKFLEEVLNDSTKNEKAEYRYIRRKRKRFYYLGEKISRSSVNWLKFRKVIKFAHGAHFRLLETSEIVIKDKGFNFNKSVRYNVFKRDDFKCVICGRNAKDDGVKLEVDHIYPRSRGGKDTMTNYQTLCRDCNVGKSNKI